MEYKFMEGSWDEKEDEDDFMEQLHIAKIQEKVNEIEFQVNRNRSVLENMAVRIVNNEQTLDVHKQGLDGQRNINNFLFEQVRQLQHDQKEYMATAEKSMRTIISHSESVALLKESYQQLSEQLASTDMDSRMRRNARMDSGVQKEKRSCQVCGKLLSAKYLRTGKHVLSKQCKKASEAAVADLFQQSPDAPFIISDVRTADAMTEIMRCAPSLECKEEIPGDL